MRDEQAPGVVSTDADRRVGQVFRRLSMIRLTLGEPVLRRAVHAILVTLGDVVLDEAEARARPLGPREANPSPGSGSPATPDRRRPSAPPD